MAFTEHAEKHNQKCPKCGKTLRCVEDYVGGGSHYWLLKCDRCNKHYTYDTYSFRLEVH